MQGDMESGRAAAPHFIESPTLAIALVIYGSWVLLTACHGALPPLVLGLCGGMIIAWHGSLQHETIHGHPTRIAWLNAAIGSIPLSMWLPYSIYRRTHVAHHATPDITDPYDDPETQYLASEGGLRFWFGKAEGSLLGRLVLGPPIRIALFLLAEAGRMRREPSKAVRDWAPHLMAVGAVLAWLRHVDFPIWSYVLTFIYPGTALSLLRSFAEHRADADRSARAAIIPKAGVFGLLFLNNNLHAVHHARPDLPWYRLPAFYREQRGAFLNGPHYESYGEIVRRFLFRPHDSLLHPDHGARVPHS